MTLSTITGKLAKEGETAWLRKGYLRDNGNPEEYSYVRGVHPTINLSTSLSREAPGYPFSPEMGEQ